MVFIALCDILLIEIRKECALISVFQPRGNINNIIVALEVNSLFYNYYRIVVRAKTIISFVHAEIDHLNTFDWKLVIIVLILCLKIVCDVETRLMLYVIARE